MSSTITSPPRALQPKSLREEIVEVVQHDIIAGHFRPGQRLVERELIQRFGVSSIPIREALQELENRGLVVRRHNCGCSVIQLSPHEAARICELRRVLEPKVMEWAAERVTPEAAAALRSQLAEVERAASAGDWSRYFQEDLKFHRMTWQVADNGYAARALETVVGSLFASGIIGSRDAATINLREEIAKHQRLLDAICDRDGQRERVAAGDGDHSRNTVMRRGS